ncbi:hypothetical protein DFH05DRAFT_1528792 [Lentinula detonsa]|uniref:RRM domain-containing protein n=1 Tax=Lentinula detonsa TaxID=2804962 RepID=A0A9W8TV00_9AGAR|nr:hypothetical protein DFH05DRAFT_1528792 [Lentinula detonsa]
MARAQNAWESNSAVSALVYKPSSSRPLRSHTPFPYPKFKILSVLNFRHSSFRTVLTHYFTRRTRICAHTLSLPSTSNFNLDPSLASHTRQRQADEDFINKSLLDQLDAEPIISSSSLSDSSTSDHHLSSSSNPNSSPESSPVLPTMRQQPPRPDSPLEQFGMYAEFDPDKRSALNGYHRASFTALPNATRPSKHHATPSALPPSTTPIFRDVGATAYQHEAYGLSSPTQTHMQPSFADRTNYAAPFGLAEPYANFSKLPHASQPHSLSHAVNPHPASMSSQTPYGPHLAANIVGMGMSSGHGSGVGNGTSANNMQEDISTIFVVGFPDDMQEREFQNMFTFSSGFEAATLKIPNKEYTAYGVSGSTGAAPGIPALNPSLASIVRAQAAMNDPYNLVTMNQGGVLVDGGRDGTMSSWPTAPIDDSYYPPGLGIGLGGMVPGVGGPGVTLGPGPNPSASGTAPGNGPVPPRKQIIGFAKFRTREEALEARDLLQGRRVDIEKGAVLKAEMAKKNLHTKRGVTANGGAGTNVGSINGSTVNPLASVGHVGPASAPLPPGSGMGLSANLPHPQYDVHLSNQAHPAELAPGGMSLRERELGTLGAMGFTGAVSSNNTSSSGTTAVPGSLSKIWDEDNRERERKVYDAMGFGFSSGDESSGPISAKESGRRLETKNGRARDESQPLRLRSGSAFDAFHSVPAFVTSSQNGLVSPPLQKTRPLALSSLNHADGLSGPWDHFAKTSAGSNVPNSASSKASHSSFNGRTRSSRSSSVAAGSTHSKHSVRDTNGGEDDEDVYTNPEMELEDPNATAKEIDVAQIARAVGSLAVATNHANGNSSCAGVTMVNGAHSQGQISPQLPSPSSGSGTSVSALSAGGASGVSASAAISSSSSSSGMRHAPAPLQHNTASSFATQNSASNINVSHLSSMLSSALPGLVSGVDQNPPINTLYVGNLPISPPPLGYPPDLLQDSLKDLFRTRPGYKRLSFKQKNTGPMCFVEFEDVNAATKAINDLYGNTLNGLVKGGGIRLSYSKNPLGIRTPTSANGFGPGFQHQHFGRDGDRERGDRYTYGGAQTLSPVPHHHSVNHRSAHTHEFMISPPPPRFSGNAAATNSNMTFGNFSSSSYNRVPAGSGSNLMFGTSNSFQGGAGPGVGYRLTASDVYEDVQGDLHTSFAPFDNGHLDHPQLPMQHQGPNPNQNQNF